MPMISGNSVLSGSEAREFGHDLFAVGHLLDVLGGNEADRVNVAEAGRDELP